LIFSAISENSELARADRSRISRIEEPLLSYGGLLQVFPRPGEIVQAQKTALQPPNFPE
jgi:hypothetical protein